MHDLASNPVAFFILCLNCEFVLTFLSYYPNFTLQTGSSGAHDPLDLRFNHSPPGLNDASVSPLITIMAILEKNGALRGTAGTVVFRRFRTHTVVQKLPERKKGQTLASRASACEFGLASTSAASIRDALNPVFRNRHDGAMVNRFNSAVYHSILGSRTAARGNRDLHDGDLDCLKGFEFNAESPLNEALKVKPVVSLTPEGRIRIQMDALHSNTDLKVPAKFREMTGRFRLRFLVTALNFRSEYYEYVAVKDVTVINGRALEAQDFEMEGTIPQGCMILVTLSLECLTRNDMDDSIELINTLSFSPAAIIAAFQIAEATPMGQSEEAKKQAWDDYSIMKGYSGNTLLVKMAELAEQAAAGQKKQRGKRSRGGSVERDPGGMKKQDVSTSQSDEGASFVVIGKRFGF
ncbi:hypothetical protein BDE36_3613 [Arcticibacter tournemirensis]|uniref:hypothetical protein n=1 Tax=Arcticibacter tournemirensis TaxID=699437 RepID=UPI0011502564|nr:hypothetical protein [Arcticibacter tournemirensis]TQM51821.1 hypothetical protein BDE36_3613 [Arcticibacter tournemirensis]